MVGDLSTQSNNRFQTPLPSYRHAAPLEMTCRRPALQSWETETNDTDTPPTVISTETEQSGVEWRNLRPNGTSASPSHCHFDRNGAKRSGVEKSPAPMVPVSPPPTVTSTETEQSGVEWSGVEKSPAPCCRPIAMGDLSAQSNNRFQTPLSPYRHAAPLEMTYGAGSSTVMGKGNNDTIPPPHCHFDRNGAKRSGVEKSPAPMAQAPLRWEISGLRASMEFKYLDLPADTQPRSR